MRRSLARCWPWRVRIRLYALETSLVMSSSFQGTAVHHLDPRSSKLRKVRCQAPPRPIYGDTTTRSWNTPSGPVSRSVYAWSPVFIPDIVTRERPDIVVQELLEVFITDLCHHKVREDL